MAETRAEKDARKAAEAEAEAKAAEAKAAADKADAADAKAREEADARERGGEDEKGTLSVYDNRGYFVRSYTPELHGKRVKEYAEEYAKKIGGTVRKAK